MDDGAIAEWKGLALGIAAVFSPATDKERSAIVAYFLRHGEALRGSEGWPADARKALAARLPARGADRPYRLHVDRAFAAKAVAIAHALLTGEVEEIPDHERDVLLEAVEAHVPWDARVDALRRASKSLRDAPRRDPAPERSPDLPHPFAFPWSVGMAADYPVAVHAGMAMAAVGSVEAREAPVSVRLRLPAGGWLPVRRHGEEWLRPVLAPDGRSTVGFAEYAALVAEAPSWADNPFLPRNKGRMTPLGLADLVTEAPPPTPAYSFGIGRRNGHEAAARDAAGRIVLLDGVVHRMTCEPMLVLVGMRDGRHRASWALGDDLSGTDCLDPILGDRGGLDVTRDRWASRDACLSLPVTCLDVLADLQASLARFEGRKASVAGGGGHEALYGRDLSGLASVSEVTRPEHVRAMSMVAGLCRSLSAARWERPHDKPRTSSLVSRHHGSLAMKADSCARRMARCGAGVVEDVPGSGAADTSQDLAAYVAGLEAGMGLKRIAFGDRVSGAALVAIDRSWRRWLATCGGVEGSLLAP